MAELLSGLIVGQVPNANHRTAMYFAVGVLDNMGLKLDLRGNTAIIREYFLDSKHILAEGKKDCERQHLELTKKTLESLLGKDQSGKLGSMTAYSFITSLSDSAKDF
jgi:hypothetical protein